MINAPYDKEFVFQDGTRAKNFLELAVRLETMDDHSFHNFVNVYKNDFANWTEHVFFDKEFADKLRQKDSRIATTDLLKEKISEISLGSKVGGSLFKTQKIADHTTHNQIEDHSDNDSIRVITSTINIVHDAPAVVHDNPKILHDASAVVHDTSVADDAINIVHYTPKTADSVVVNSVPIIPVSVTPVKSDSKIETNVKSDKLETDLNKDKNISKKTSALKFGNVMKIFSKKTVDNNSNNVPNSTNISSPNPEKKKIAPELYTKTFSNSEQKDNALWIILYFALILVIITLLLYKLFL